MKHPHNARTEAAVIYGTPVTLCAGIGAVVFLPALPPYIGIVIATVSIAAFGLVHCIRTNRKRRARHQKQEIC